MASATKNAMVAISSDMRTSYESEAGRLTTSMASVDGHVELMRSDIVGLRGKLSGCVATVETLTRGLVTAVEETKTALEE